MATYFAATILGPVAVSTSNVAYGPSNTPIIRTFRLNGTTACGVTMGIGAAGAADAVTNRILDNFSLTPNVPYAVNGWFVLQPGDKINLWCSTATPSAPVFFAWGYTYA